MVAILEAMDSLPIIRTLGDSKLLEGNTAAKATNSVASHNSSVVSSNNGEDNSSLVVNSVASRNPNNSAAKATLLNTLTKTNSAFSNPVVNSAVNTPPQQFGGQQNFGTPQ
jgi:hypothetical protein